MEDLYYYTEIRRRSGNQFIGLDGALISGVAICSARLDLTDYGTQINPLLQLKALNGLEYFNVDFKISSQIESLSDNIFLDTLSKVSTMEATACSLLSRNGRNFRNWMQSINELNGTDVFANASIDVYLCSGKFCGAIYAGADIWRTPDYNHTVELTSAEFPYFRETTDSSLKIMKGVLRDYPERGYVINFSIDSWDSDLKKPLQVNNGNNTVRSSIKSDPVIFGFAYPGFDGDNCACFPTNQTTTRFGNFGTSALPLYQPETKNICIFDETSGYCGINYNPVKIDSETNKLTISTDTAASTDVARNSTQNWILTEEERKNIKNLFNPTQSLGVDFYELGSFVNGEEIKIHDMNGLQPTDIVDIGGVYTAIYGGRLGGINSRGWGTEKKDHSAGETYSENQNDSGAWLDVFFVVPPASMDDKYDVAFASSGLSKGSNGDFFKFYKLNKFLQLKEAPTDEKILKFGAQIYSDQQSAGIFGTATNNHFVFFRPEQIGNNEKDLLINVIANIDYETISCGTSGVTATESIDQRSTILVGVNKYGASAGEVQKSGVWNWYEYDLLVQNGAQIPTPQMTTNWGFRQLDGESVTSYIWSQTLLKPYDGQANYNLRNRKQVAVNFDSGYQDNLTLDSIALSGSASDGNWFLHHLKLRSRWDNGIAFHSIINIHRYTFSIFVRKYLDSAKVYSTGYGAKSGIDGSLILTSADATREVLANYANAGGLLVNFSKPRAYQTITGWAEENTTVRDFIQKINSSTLSGVVLGADGICYDFDPIGGASTKTILVSDILSENQTPMVSKGSTSSENLKTGIRLNFRQFPDESGYSASYYIDHEKIIDWTGEVTRVSSNFIDQDYWNLFSFEGLSGCCAAFSRVRDELLADDILEVDCPMLRDRTTAELMLLHLVLAYTSTRKILTFDGLIESFKDVKIGQIVTWGMENTIIADSRFDGKKYIVKKKTLNADKYSYSLVIEECLIQ